MPTQQIKKVKTMTAIDSENLKAIKKVMKDGQFKNQTKCQWCGKLPAIDGYYCEKCKPAQTKKENWEKEFDEAFWMSLESEHSERDKIRRQKIKHFISQLLKQKRAKTIEEVMGEVEKWLEKRIIKKGSIEWSDSPEYVDGNNSIISALKAKLKKEIK